MNRSDKEDIFSTILKDYSQKVTRICWGFAVDESDVKDLYQDVMINVWKGLSGFRSESAYSTWIHRIAVNTCLLWKKRKKNYSEIPEQLETDARVANDAIGSFQNPQLLNLKKAINLLKDSDKTFILLVLEELSYQEIAEVTGLSISNIGVKINRIKTRLKKHMEKSI